MTEGLKPMPSDAGWVEEYKQQSAAWKSPTIDGRANLERTCL
jgi:hypothetical protein